MKKNTKLHTELNSQFRTNTKMVDFYVDININLTKFELMSLGDGRDDTRSARVLGYKTLELPTSI